MEEYYEELEHLLDKKCESCTYVNGRCPEGAAKCSKDTNYYKYQQK